MLYNINTTDDVKKMLNFAESKAKEFNSGDIATEFLLAGILCLKGTKCCELLDEFGVLDTEFFDILSEGRSEDIVTKQPELTPKSKKVFVMAKTLAEEEHSEFIDVEHILFSILMSGDCVAVSILDKVFNVNIIELKNKLLELIKQKSQKNTENFAKNNQNLTNLQQNIKNDLFNKTNSNAENSQKNIDNQIQKIDENKKANPLDDLGIDLTQKAKMGKIDPIIGRDKEIERVVEILCRKTKNNPCLVGEAGVGKSAVIEGLALKIIEGDVPKELKNKTIFSFDISGLMSGTKFRGAFEQKLRNAINEIIKNGNIIVFMDEIHTLVQTSSEKGEVSPADILKPYLARGEIRTIGATTNDEYRKYLEKDKALERRFQPVVVNPPSKEDTYLILKGIRDSYEAFHGVKISDDALKSAIELSDRYITNRNFPDKAIDLIDEASSRAKLFDGSVPSEILEIEKQVV
ncbi:MAG: ATP-dependent Clp protease ATP-binding subunit, partial [Clostridia bacterium]|nr:ATP-dependent Clp protease ATP-binding subunit [Clostridia bacterium]